MSLHPEVRAHVEAIEARLVELDDALAQPDPLRLEACAQDLHRTLADSLSAFRHASATGADPMSADLRHRLSLAQTRVIQLQQNLHYATHAISRTLDVLLPRARCRMATKLCASNTMARLSSLRKRKIWLHS